ncbi:MAG: DUF1826 domain-containing protein [Deltaproteobacteria bacterium]|nr:DUF1826 domain-containing protein [Deltaproteobacteria bacterium]
MLSTQTRNLSTLRRADAEAEASERLAHGEVNLVSWHRELPLGLDAQLVEWAERFPAKFDEVVAMPNYDLSAATRGLAEPARTWLTLDVAGLIARLSLLADARRLRVSLGAVRTDQCRKFHVDYVRYRLITTYVGPGTEWVPDAAVRREALDHPPDCPCDANKEIVQDASAIRHAVPGEVIVMKGALHRNHHGAVHRSPPIEGTGRVRVVLVATTVDRS